MIKKSLFVFLITFLILSSNSKTYGHTHVRKEERTFQEMTKERKQKFREELNLIKDDRKKKIVERISDNLTSKNEKWMTHFNNVLKRLSEILEKISDRAQRAEKNGKDVNETEQAIENAKQAIDEAQEAVNTQSAKDYTIEITDEETAKDAITTAKDQLKTDLKNVREKVKKAREAVHATAVTLGKNL